MYNSQNLPLEKRKIIKKSLSAIVASLFFSLFAAVMVWIVLSSMNGDGFNFLYALLTFLLVNLLIGGSVVFYQYLYYKFYYYNFEDDKAEIKKGVIANATGHVRYARIQNIYLDQDVLDRIFRLYDVHYETAGEASGFYSHVDGLSKENADKLTEFLNSRVQGGNLAAPMSSGSGPEKVIADNIDENDERIFTRENVPVDNKLIFLNAASMAFVYGIFFFFLVGRIFIELTAAIGGFWFIGIVVPIVLIILFSYVYAKIWYSNFYFKFDKTGGVIKEKVISSSDKHLYYDRIQNIDVSQGILERLFGLNNVVIETASEGTKLKALAIPGLERKNADLLKDYLLDKSKKYRSI